MSWLKFLWADRRPSDEPEPDPARRRMLLGLGAATCAIAVGAPLFSDDAEAASGDLADDLLSRIDGEDDESYETAHYTGYRHRHGGRRRRRRRRGRRRRGRGRCRDRWFRRNNPGYCGVRGRRRRRRRRGGCVQIGPVTVCD
ncbi:hypothetical protein [Jiella marina]|uniref:hypothetical protein n=1 Tax=Jiella sp. LLJ827 TaxID=2917712 RepID=UPI0021017DBD|nr:hypothetical protein [Jiella sp. LLJ827]MCQ0988406.1 hypothetical protein [Jiella sp. LLJ827]